MTDTRTKPEPANVTAARIAVQRRRGELLDTAQLLQSRLAPKTLAADAWEKARVKGADLAEDAVDAVKARPVAAGGAAAAIVMFLARQPIKDAAVKLYDAMTSRSTPTEPSGVEDIRPAGSPGQEERDARALHNMEIEP
jgi:hypothetical protein